MRGRETAMSMVQTRRCNCHEDCLGSGEPVDPVHEVEKIEYPHHCEDGQEVNASLYCGEIFSHAH